MNRRPNSRLILLVLGLCLASAACGGPPAAVAPSPAVVVKSEDGKAQLTIPDGALPAGHSLAEIRILRQPDPGPADSLSATYVLEPNGLVFRRAITFALALAGDSLPLPVLSSTKGLEFPADVQSDIDPTTKQVTVRANITHFSEITFYTGFFTSTLTEPGSRFLNESFPVTFNLRRTEQTKWIAVNKRDDVGRRIFIRLPDKKFTIRDGRFIDNTSPQILSPGTTLDAPATEDADGSVSSTRPLQCAKLGTGDFVYSTFLDFQTERGYINSSGDEVGVESQPIKLRYYHNETVQCVNAKLTGTLLPPATLFKVTTNETPTKYAWTGKIGCGTFISNGAEAQWMHPNAPAGGVADPGTGAGGSSQYCPHSDVPNFSHPGTITVVLTDPAAGNSFCTYQGSLTGTGECKRGTPPP